MRIRIAHAPCLLLSILVLQAQAGDLVLVDDGRAACTIAVPDKADSFTRMAASWLVDYVQQSSGATLKAPHRTAPSSVSGTPGWPLPPASPPMI